MKFRLRGVPCNRLRDFPARPPPSSSIEKFQVLGYRGTSLIRKRTLLGPYRRPMPRVLGESWWGGRFLMGEVPLYGRANCSTEQAKQSPPPLFFLPLPQFTHLRVEESRLKIWS